MQQPEIPFPTFKPWWAGMTANRNAGRDWDIYEWEDGFGHFFTEDIHDDETSEVRYQGSLFQPLQVTADKSKYFDELCFHLRTQR